MNDPELVALLRAIEPRALQALIATLDDLPDTVPGLQAWLAHAAQWERDRRQHRHYPLQSPIAGIDVADLPRARVAAQALAGSLRDEWRDDVRAVFAFLDGVARVLAAACPPSGHAVH